MGESRVIDVEVAGPGEGNGERGTAEASAPSASAPTTEEYGIKVFDAIQNEGSALTDAVRKVEEHRHRSLICYCANFAHPGNSIVLDDDNLIEVLLKSIDFKKYDGRLDFMIHSPGGDPMAAERIVQTLRSYASSLEVIIPKTAMSAATLIALAADRIVVSATSELGPIDPQMIERDQSGRPVNSRAAILYIRAYQDLVAKVKESIAANSNPQPYLEMILRTQNPVWIQECIRAQNLAKDLALEFLSSNMLKGDQKKAGEIAQQLREIGEETSHGKPIRPKRAKDMGLVLAEYDVMSEEWKAIWELHLRTTLYVQRASFAKYLGCRTRGININVQVMR